MRLLLLLSFMMVSIFSYAGGRNENGGGRGYALSGATATKTDVWSATNNVGALGLQNQFALGVAYESRFFLPQTGLRSMALVAPIGSGTFSLVGHQFGHSSYQDSRVGLGFARKLNEYISLGVQINYVNVRLGDIYGSRSALAAEIGLLIMPRDNLKFAFTAYNPNRAKLADFDDERLPSTLSLAGEYEFSEKVSATVQLDKDLDLPLNIITAIEYEPVERFAIRTGFATAQGTMSFGFGYEWNKINFDVAARWQQNLGFNSAFSLSYAFGKRKKKA